MACSMTSGDTAVRMLANEARALLTRLATLRPFALQMPMVSAATVSPSAHVAIERYLIEGRRELHDMVQGYIGWLNGNICSISPVKAQQRFTFLKLQFNNVISQFDTFSDVLNQRSEHGTGVWLSGLDAVAADSLMLPGNYYNPPPVICYLDRGIGASIRRARTRMPGGGENPVAIVQIPRERMVGSGIASSLVHEVGHQGSALLDLVNSLRPVLQGMQKKGGSEYTAWVLYERWISEILADFWSVAKVGVASSMGLISVVSLPRTFVFRVNMDDPHPIPWIRVKLSCAMGNALYPHEQWGRLARLWESLYPVKGLDSERRQLLALLEATMPALVSLIVNHRPKALSGNSLKDVMPVDERQPARLAAYYRQWQRSPASMRSVPPSLVFAAIGQAKADGTISPKAESRVLSDSLTHWALRSSLENTSYRSIKSQHPAYKFK